MNSKFRKINSSEKILLSVLLENLRVPYFNNKYKFSRFIVEWIDGSGSFDFYYFPIKNKINNVIGNISRVCFYDKDGILCEATLSSYKDENLLSCVDILKLSGEPLIRIPDNKMDFFIEN